MSTALDAFYDMAGLPAVLTRFVQETEYDMTERDFFVFMSTISQGSAWALAEEDDVMMVAERTIPGLHPSVPSMLAEHFAAVMSAVSGFMGTLNHSSLFEGE